MSPSATLEPLRGGALATATVGIAVLTAMTVLDSTIANVALSTIAGNLGVAVSQGTWVITFFGVANAVAIPLTGWLARRMGEVRLYFAASALFVLASFLCGISTSLGMLIFFRLLQGVAAGPILPLSQSLLLACYPPEKRGLALSLWSMVVVLAPILGPILGGWICDNYHWGWIFFVNVPVGALGLLLLRAPLRGRETPKGKAPIDVVGLVLLVVGIGCLQLMLDEGKDHDWFSSSYIIALGVAAVVGIAFFIAWELTEEHPVVNLSLFRHRNFTVGTICISLGFLLYFASVVLLPLMLQSRLSYTAMWAGFSLAPVGIFPLIISPILGKQARRLDMRLMASLSFLVFASCFFWRAGSTPGMDFISVALPQLVLGIGVALFFMPLTSIILSGLPNSALAGASSLSNCVRVLAGSIGSSLVTTLWERREALHHARLSEQINDYNSVWHFALRVLQDSGMDQSRAQAWIANEITRQGFILGFDEIFWLGGVLFLLLSGTVWLARRI